MTKKPSCVPASFNLAGGCAAGDAFVDLRAQLMAKLVNTPHQDRAEEIVTRIVSSCSRASDLSGNGDAIANFAHSILDSMVSGKTVEQAAESVGITLIEPKSVVSTKPSGKAITPLPPIVTQRRRIGRKGRP